MAQAGWLSRPRKRRVGPDRSIFTRMGASDDLAGGQSTFMLEMDRDDQRFTAPGDRSLRDSDDEIEPGDRAR